jgi:hypothetical protein
VVVKKLGVRDGETRAENGGALGHCHVRVNVREVVYHQEEDAADEVGADLAMAAAAASAVCVALVSLTAGLHYHHRKP